MGRDPTPVFLEKSTYRRRRAMDAIKMLAVAGAGLWMVPVLWPVSTEAEASPVSMSDALFFIFGVWLFLIVLAATLMIRVRHSPEIEVEEGQPK